MSFKLIEDNPILLPLYNNLVLLNIAVGSSSNRLWSDWNLPIDRANSPQFGELRKSGDHECKQIQTGIFLLIEQR